MEALTIARLSFGAVVALAGLVLILGGTLGLLRFPDVYTRLHAAGVSDGPGAAIFLVGLAIMAPDAGLGVRLLFLAALIVALGPVLSHLIGNAAHSGGLAPIAGPYTAPRPGAARAERDA
ncbi:MAG: monovalent cation/H(+) antiporter subunit G [Phycisphaerales bacterium]|nr:monovalent cation/H(+) antiporter subunit G [Hyphomonadaceae bacterium]